MLLMNRASAAHSLAGKDARRPIDLLPAPASCLVLYQGWPKRARYSGDEMNANTISAFTKLPLN